MALVWALLASIALVQAGDVTDAPLTTTEQPQETTMLADQPDNTVKPVEPPFYIVTAPEKLRPFSEYTVSVTLLGTAQPVSVTVGLYGTEKDNNFVKTSVVSVEPNTTKLAKIQIEDLKPGSYNLTVRGDDSFQFDSSTALRFVEKFLSVFIQTDKAMYKPGHKVQLRILVLDAYLKPSAMNQIDVILKDGANNRVKEWKKVSTVKGVYSGEIQLSSYPVLGDWTIVVKSGGKEYSKKFTVAEYVLPKFEVIVDVPQHATYDNSKVPVTVRAKYTYGQLVKGEATIKIRPQYTYYHEVTKPNAKTIKVDTEATTDIDIVEILELTDNQFYERTVIFDVSFKEDLTGKVLNGSASVKLHHAKCKVDFVSSVDNLVPGEPYKTQLKISTWDDTPYQGDGKTPVKIRFGRRWSERENATWKEYPFPEGGVLDLTFPTDADTEFLNIEADYSGIPAFLTVSKKQVDETKNNSSLDLVLADTKNAKIGDKLDLDVVTEGNTQFLVYHVVARHTLAETKTLTPEPGQTKMHVSVPVSQGMAPESHVIAYYVSPSGKLIAAEKEIKIGDIMANYVKLSASPNETEPGQDTQIMIESKPNSYVALMGIDQSVLLLKKGNDISREDVENDMRNYDNPWYGTGRSFGGGRRFGGWYGGHGDSVKDIFYRAGAVVMTNAYIPEDKVVGWHFHRPMILYSAMGGGLADIARPMAPSADRIDEKATTLLVEPVVRSKFPETWIWDVIDSGSDGKTSFNKTVPDTITSWVISGFSISPEFGLGLSDKPAEVKVFRPFFISLNLPYSVTRGESIVIPANVFNYMNDEVTCDVTLDNTGWFKFATNSTDSKRKRRETDNSRTKKLKIGPNSAATANFVIEPQKLGYMELKVTARSAVAGDAVSRKLLVKPEGETQYRTKGLFVDLRDGKDFKTEVDLDIPKDCVPDSELIVLSGVGDLLGTPLQNVDKLIRQPFGCGEQNMLNFVPNIVILDYLKNADLLTPAIESKSLKYMEMGYQRELTYKHKDNSYSAFGETDEKGSTWLTAFVAKSFRQAQKFIDIDNSAIVEPLKWLAKTQAPNGSFPEVGHVSHKDMQGGGSHGLALTAYVLTAFAEAMTLTDEFKEPIDRAVRYINEQIENNAADTYSLAVAAYALNMVDHPAKDKANSLLESRAKTVGELKYWEKEKDAKDATDEGNPWYHEIPNSVNVEITSYALLTYIQREKVTEGLPILKWLLSQQNSDGGFASTQDTVVALAGMAKLAKSLSGNGKDLTITFDYPPRGSSNITVNQDNALVHQKIELSSKKIRSISVTAKGTGFAVAQINYRYNIDKKGAFPMFNLDPKVDEASTKEHLLLDVCTTYKGSEASNMAVMEVTLPSGYTIDDEGVKGLRLTPRVKRVETKDEDTVVILYFDKVTSEPLCPTISAYRSFKVAKQRPVPVTIYDYYDTSKRATEFYSPPLTDINDICGEEDC